MTRIGRVALVRDNGCVQGKTTRRHGSAMAIAASRPGQTTLTTQLVHAGLVGTLVDTASLSLDQILDLLPLLFPHRLFWHFIRLHLGRRTVRGRSVGTTSTSFRVCGVRGRPCTRYQSAADIVLALLALLGTVDPRLVDILERQVDRSKLRPEFVGELRIVTSANSCSASGRGCRQRSLTSSETSSSMGNLTLRMILAFF